MSSLPILSASLSQDETALIHQSPKPAHGPVNAAARLWRSDAKYALGDQVVFSFGNMVVAAMVSRYGSLGALGVYILTQRAMDVLIQLSNGVLWMPFTFNAPRLAGRELALYKGSLLFWQSVFCLIFSGLLWGITEIVTQQRLPTLQTTPTPLIVASIGILFLEFTRRMYFSDLRLREAFWTDVATVLLQIGGVWFLLRQGKLSVSGTLGALAVGGALVSLWWVAREWPSWKFEMGQARVDLQRDLGLGGWLFAGNLVALVSAQCNPWMLDAALGTTAVGTYSICESLVNIPRAGLTSMQNVMGPKVAREHGEKGVSGMKAVIRRMNLSLMAVSSLSGIVLVAAGPYVAHLIYGQASAGTRFVTALLAANLVAFTATLAQMYGLTALRRPRLIFFANAAGVAVQLVLCGLFVQTLRIPGAALALLGGNLVVLVVRHRLYARSTNEAALPEESAAVASLFEA